MRRRRHGRLGFRPRRRGWRRYLVTAFIDGRSYSMAVHARSDEEADALALPELQERARRDRVERLHPLTEG